MISGVLWCRRNCRLKDLSSRGSYLLVTTSTGFGGGTSSGSVVQTSCNIEHIGRQGRQQSKDRG